MNANTQQTPLTWPGVCAALNDAVITCDREMRIVCANAAACALFGLHRQMLIGRAFSSLLGRSENIPLESQTHLCQACDPSACGVWRFGRAVLCAAITAAGPRPVEYTLSSVGEGDARFIIVVLRDISERIDELRNAHHEALHDALTGLPNRAYLKQRLAEAMGQGETAEALTALLFIDLDDFKDVNDTLGHDVGDELLCQIADRLSLSIRSTDFVARLGGDEFAVIVTDILNIEEAEATARRLISAITAPVRVRGLDLYVSCSIGIAYHPFNDASPEDLLRFTDIAMYRSKAAGKNTYTNFDTAFFEEIKVRKDLEHRLRQGVENDEMFFRFQPQIDLATGRVCGVEALIRWNHPQAGILAPDEFIPLAEENGLIHLLGDWVIRAACRHLKSWMAQGLEVPTLFLNVSPLQLRDPSFVEGFLQTAVDMDVPLSALGIEITESSMLHATPDMVVQLGRLRSRGVRVAIDDFGVGYSAISHLRDYSIDKIKLDRSFLEGIDSEAPPPRMARALICFVKNLGLRVTAEGVERQSQYELISAWGCDEAQGHLFGKAMSEAKLIERFLRPGCVRASASDPALPCPSGKKACAQAALS
ncbi:sensor domain-containing protein [Thioalkalivibrio thiocyanodenitrificans]|uniref:sensor domain-containing protein n=1 Tax=Thioalkalivibrio thiocyanodenitrificans TaxID=243063 RepID=UPI000372A9D5|nr:EAL domain-containing protein [Thioalkalivibrio thiocyanodenitrificans]